MLCLVTQSCLTLCDPMDCSPPGSSMGIIQARILEWVAISSSKGSSPSRDQSRVSYTAGFAVWATREAIYSGMGCCFLPQGNLPNPGIESRFPTLQPDSLPSEPPGKPKNTGVGSLSLLQGIFPTQEEGKNNNNNKKNTEWRGILNRKPKDKFYQTNLIFFFNQKMRYIYF